MTMYLCAVGNYDSTNFLIFDIPKNVKMTVSGSHTITDCMSLYLCDTLFVCVLKSGRARALFVSIKLFNYRSTFLL